MKQTQASAKGKANGSQTPAKGVKSLVTQLKQLWAPHARKGLEVRHEMGARLNARLGSPLERQPQGARILKQVSEELEVHESELSRMRWFAYLFSSLKVLNRQFPGDRSWAQAKARLPLLIATAKGTQLEPNAGEPDRTTAVLGGIRKSMENAASKLGQKGLRLDDAQRQALLSGLRKLAQAAERRLKVRVSIEQD